MLDPHNVISVAIHGYAEKIARRMEISLPRLYQILGDNCPYVRAKRIIRAIAAENPKGARLIKADIDAMWADILHRPKKEYTAVELHKEAFEAIQSILEHRPGAYRKEQLRELITVAQSMYDGIDRNPDSGRIRAVK